MKEIPVNKEITPFYNCPICSKFENRIEINIGRLDEKLPQEFETFENIWRESTKSHYEYSTRKIIKCKTCQTFYGYHYYFDNEDSPMTPITEIITITRWGHMQARIEMQKLNFDDEVAKIDQQYSQLLEIYIKRLQKKIGKKTFHKMKIPIQEIIDYSLYVDKGRTLEEVLLKNNNSKVVVQAIQNLISANKGKNVKIHNYDEKIQKSLKKYVKHKTSCFQEICISWLNGDDSTKIEDGLDIINTFLSYKVNIRPLSEHVIKLISNVNFYKQIMQLCETDFLFNEAEFAMPLILQMMLSENEKMRKEAMGLLNLEIKYNKKLKAVYIEELNKLKEKEVEIISAMIKL